MPLLQEALHDLFAFRLLCITIVLFAFLYDSTHHVYGDNVAKFFAHLPNYDWKNLLWGLIAMSGLY